MEKASLQRQLAEAEAARAHNDFDGMVKEARETVENQPVSCEARRNVPCHVTLEELITVHSFQLTCSGR